MSYYRAAASRRTAGTANSTWHGRWHHDRDQAEQQAVRWKFENTRPADVVWLEQLVDGRPVCIALLAELDEDGRPAA